MKHLATALVLFVPFIPCILFTCVAPVSGMRILAIQPVAARSHWNFMGAVLRVLFENGHNVTVFTPFPSGDRVNYTEVDVSNLLPVITNVHGTEIFKNFVKFTVFVPLTMNMTRYFCQIIYETDQIKDILRDENSGSNFDVVIGEITSSDCISYMAAKLNLPMIYLIPSPVISHIEYDLFGHMPNPAIISNLVSDFGVPKTFGQRLKNVAYLVYTVIATKYQKWILTKNDPQPFDFIKPVKPSLVFINSHYISEAARSLPSNVVQVGGVHLERPSGIPDVSIFVVKR